MFSTESLKVLQIDNYYYSPDLVLCYLFWSPLTKLLLRATVNWGDQEKFANGTEDATCSNGFKKCFADGEKDGICGFV